MLRTLLPALFAASAALAADPAVFTIKTMTAQMKYNVTELLATPGQPCRLVFENGDDLPHNLVFCQPGTDTAAMSLKQMEKPDEALKRNWLPDDPRIWLHTKMLNPHEKQELQFTAPTKPGTYPYVCTFPGHALTMRGELRVSPAGEGLKDLRFALYLGNWKTLPDFAALKPHREGPVPSNLIEVKLDDYKNEFGVVFTGRLDAPKTGNYRFFLASDDGARLLIDGKEVLINDGIHPASTIKEGATKLEKGTHEYRLEYFQAAGNIELYAAWKGADFQITPLSKWLHPDWKGGAKKKKDFDPIPLVVGKEPVIYRNFIAGAGNRGIAVGFPGGINLAWSAESMNLALLWRGAFIDAAQHWNSRGGGHVKPLGYDVIAPAGESIPALHLTDKPEGEWPAWDKTRRFEGFEWKGYTLDAARSPHFRYTFHGAEVEEHFTTEGDGSRADGKPALIRHIRIRGPVAENAWLRIASGPMQAQDGAFLCQSGPLRYRVRAEGARIAGANLVLPVKAGEMSIRYEW
ncbi:MAG: hypothetical protein RLZZ476_2371 [Verrucomicrobiota bacterium]|jgi:azurin